MKNILSIVPVLVALGACSAPRYADFGNLTVPVEVRHPPRVGFVVEEVAIAPLDRSRLPTRVVGADDLDPVTCRNELVQAVTEKLLELGIAVVQYGNHQGADAVVAIDVTRCSTERDTSHTMTEIVETVGGNTRRREVPVYHAATRMDFAVLVEVADPSSNNRVVASRMITHQPESVESSTDGYPDSPSATFPLREAYAHALVEIEPLFVEQVDANSISFFDDERCDLNPAFSAVHSGNYERAMELSLENAESCEDVAAAHYNVGVLHRIMGDFEAAMEHLRRASEADPANAVIRSAMAEVRSAQDAAASRARVQQYAIEEERQDAARAGEVVTNADVLRMIEEGLPDAIVIQVIETSEVEFDVRPATLVQLNRQGVSQAVISAMIAAAGG